MGRDRSRTVETKNERALVTSLVEQSVDDPLAPFVPHPHKRYVFSPDGAAVIGYTVRLGVAVASGDPVGRLDSWRGAVERFVALAARHRWRLAVLGAGERARNLWMAYGLRAVPVGRDVVVRTHAWTLEGRRFRNLRQAIRRTHNVGVTAQLMYEADVPETVIVELRALRHGVRRDTERGFSMILGQPWDGRQPDALVALARDRHGRLIAAQRYLRAGARDLSLDHSLRAPDAPNGSDERLVAETVAWSGRHGVERVSLAFAPFPDLFAAPAVSPAGAAAFALHVLDPLIRLRRLYRYLRKYHAFDRERFVMLRFRHLIRVLVVLLWLEFR